jgi:type II secretory pathway predicted ATPase ExeA
MTISDPRNAPEAQPTNRAQAEAARRSELRVTTPGWPRATWDEGGLAGLRQPIYGAFYGLAESPFDLTPNPRFLFLSERQREALSNLRYALATSRGFTLILGEAGTGKTTLVRTALAELGGSASRYVMINNPTLTRAEFCEHLAREFGLGEEAAVSKPRFLSALKRDVEARFAAGGLSGLIIDEAQSLPHELLEEIRLLGNIETATAKLLNIVLSGQPELADRLNDTGLRQLKQRIALRCQLGALNLQETAAYISGRLRIAGGSPSQIFTRETVVAIFETSSGIPRTINVLCENALLGGFASQIKPIPVDVIQEVCRDFDLPAEKVTSGNAPPPVKPNEPLAAPKQTPPHAPAAADGEEGLMFSSLKPKKGRFSFFS